MSGIYLVLRRRLEDVVDWVELGTDVMRTSRKARGYSYEAMGRQLNVAAKTWERWEKAGRVPRHNLDRVADVLNLELERPARRRVTIADAPDDDEATQPFVEWRETMLQQMEALADGQRDLASLLEGVLEELVPARRVPARRRRAG